MFNSLRNHASLPSNNNKKRRLARESRSHARRRVLVMESLERRDLLATMTWDGGGADGNWLTAANWAGDIAPRSGDDLIFQGATGGRETSELESGMASPQAPTLQVTSV